MTLFLLCFFMIDVISCCHCRGTTGYNVISRRKSQIICKSWSHWFSHYLMLLVITLEIGTTFFFFEHKSPWILLRETEDEICPRVSRFFFFFSPPSRHTKYPLCQLDFKDGHYLSWNYPLECLKKRYNKFLPQAQTSLLKQNLGIDYVERLFGGRKVD